jgi:L-serine kinase (ADP)
MSRMSAPKATTQLRRRLTTARSACDVAANSEALLHEGTPVTSPAIEMVDVDRLLHIEGFSKRRVDWLAGKILAEGVWTKPVALDEEHDLVLDGQHRMETAKRLGLRRVPAVRYVYADVELWSLRPAHQFDWQRVTERALAARPYPYKTVKHRFPDGGLPQIAIPLDALRQ